MLSTVDIQNRLIHEPKYKGCFSKLTFEEIGEINNELMSVLKSFDKICRENNITYMLVAGALIGAVRNGTCIPWDDDIDLVMPRKDYEKVGKILENSKYSNFIMSYPQNSDVITMGAHFYRKGKKIDCFTDKDIGNSKIYESYVYLDILPLDNCINNKILDKIKGSFINLIQISYISRRCFKKNDRFLNYLSNDSRKLKLNITLRKIIALPLLLFTPKQIFRVLKKMLYNCEKSNFSTISFGAKRYFGEKMPREIWYPISEIELNGYKVMAPNKPKMYLEHRYGDYFKIPSLEEQEERMIKLKGNWDKYVANNGEKV